MLSQHTPPPNHIAIIMDGNGRWAEQQQRSRTYGHRAGHTALLKIVRHAAAIGVQALTLYAFSSENWQRPEKEVSALMQLFRQALKRNRRLFVNNNIRFNVIGDTTAFSEKLRDDIATLEYDAKDNTGLNVNIAANYGARWDITQATRAIAQQVYDGELTPAEINEESLNRHMCLSDQAPVDLLIRTGGELRISNYLLWQCAYAEFYFTPIFWPDFDESALDTAITEFNRRNRRFGGVETTLSGTQS